MDKKFNNALVNETSPYLLQHAHNPVNWYPWGDQALSLAKEKDLPILVSIGYSACHWCHVMERESFEDETVAAYMNEHFINIKIDREERPDLDHIYMDALQAISGSGGWPLNVFLTTDAKPFYGGTYFPPQKISNRSSWIEVLKAMVDVWINKRNDAEEQANNLISHIKKSNNFEFTNSNISVTEETSFLNDEDCRSIVTEILKNADILNGGFWRAPKFLQTYSIQFLFQYSHFFDNKASKEHAVLTLKKMLNGGIYDQLAGGISRYSTDNEWLAPHFEKMLYDNALFTTVLCDAYQITKEKTFEAGIRNTLDFLIKEMKHPEGGYFTAIDADSEGEEGKFYVWQKKEIDEILGDKSSIFCAYFNVSEAGNWEGKNILNSSESTQILEKYQISETDFDQMLSESRRKLLEVRKKRIPPGIDDKILLGSNALLISAFCKAYAALKEPNYKNEAIELYRFIEEKLKDEVTNVGYKHTYKNKNAKHPAFLDDYAYLIQACIHLQEITSDHQYLIKAKELLSFVLNNFGDENSAFLYFTHKDQRDIVVRKIEVYDGATPSANAIMAQNLLYLGIVFDENEWILKGNKMLISIFNAFKKYPSSFAVWAGIYLLQTVGINEIALTGKEIKPTLEAFLAEYVPNKVIQSSTVALEWPLLLNKQYETDVTFYLCRNYSCKKPIYELAEFLRLINEGRIKKRGAHNI